jgi:hypothetical protein
MTMIVASLTADNENENDGLYNIHSHSIDWVSFFLSFLPFFLPITSHRWGCGKWGYMYDA